MRIVVQQLNCFGEKKVNRLIENSIFEIGFFVKFAVSSSIEVSNKRFKKNQKSNKIGTYLLTYCFFYTLNVIVFIIYLMSSIIF